MTTNNPSDILLYGTQEDSIVDGPGLRFCIFTQGCKHNCPGCHNPESQNLEGGYKASLESLYEEIRANKIIQGVTFSGGEPLLQTRACLALAKQLSQQGFNIWLYSGYLYEDIMGGSLGSEARELLSYCDVLVDGPFIESLHVYDLLWRGSTNQRVIDIKKSAQAGQVTLWESHDDYPTAPSSW
ncbi:MAG: anaerobic ribonucleoside-triphosphate reductase activating protein [Raoultibacter sp.]|jgi:anaerobic ribonucleoside-triphosphate reductase activating protein